MTLKWVPNIWLSDSPDTDCRECGLRYFAHCVKCRKIVCTWCCLDNAKNAVLCDDCHKTESKGTV